MTPVEFDSIEWRSGMDAAEKATSFFSLFL